MRLILDGKDLYGQNGGAAPSGGAQGQALVKRTSTDGDIVWSYPGKELTWAEYQALPTQEKNTGLYYIPDAPDTDFDANDLPIADTENLLGHGAGYITDGQTLVDEIADEVSQLNQSLTGVNAYIGASKSITGIDLSTAGFVRMTAQIAPDTIQGYMFKYWQFAPSSTYKFLPLHLGVTSDSGANFYYYVYSTQSSPINQTVYPVYTRVWS